MLPANSSGVMPVLVPVLLAGPVTSYDPLI